MPIEDQYCSTKRMINTKQSFEGWGFQRVTSKKILEGSKNSKNYHMKIK